ncbi:transporter substrate-binding domain-containing protein [Paenibacillus sp. FSL W8-1187]|uniref:Glutamine ABC transporter, periplasmic glutamine-binding protein n=1 Tax=Paenibacillus pasadenensis TaxID=217090 RepID=A0A2N5N2I7_9BACL|nr:MULTISPECIES: transporter substrate-binding domain-containing protein [Paenibacillus]PLT44542.1 Glutamine ABC transporter, periplasmic glutamine-binding protein [Paenibacillus pasadenensis]QGG55006.1 transporter substrate-binding domain-containing protein [Paenibacillus sp. B01]
MRKRRWLGAGASLLLLATVALTGCGAKNEPASTNTGGSASTAPADDGSAVQAIKDRGKLVVGVKFDTKLFGLKDPGSGEVEGFDIDVARAIAKKILGDETKLELKEVTSKTRIPMLDNGEIDLIVATMTINEERKTQVDFSDVYFHAGQSLLVKKGSAIKSIDDVTKDTKVIGQKGATSIKNIEEKVPGLRVQQYENYQEAFTALKAGKGEVLTTDNAILFGMSQQDPEYVVVGGTFTDEPYGIAAKKGNADLVAAVNETLKELKDSGDYAALYEKWMGEKPPEE